MEILKKVDSVAEYIENIKNLYKHLYPDSKSESGYSFENGLFFRGLSDFEYKLIPTVLREGNSRKEKIMLLNFRDFMPQHNLSYDFIHQRIEILAMMQHYVIPTRLMDWTFSPLIALYFAVSKKEDKEGAVVIFNPWLYVRNDENLKPCDKYPDSHEAHIFARALLSDRNKDMEGVLNMTNDKYNVKFYKDTLELPFPFVASFNNPRILHQKGCFTIHGNCSNDFETQLNNKKDIYLKKIIIRNKTNILRELRMLFINEYSIYPDFQGMSTQINKDKSLYKVYFNF